jgi:hypothetical protein
MRPSPLTEPTRTEQKDMDMKPTKAKPLLEPCITIRPNGAFRFTDSYLKQCGGPIEAIDAPTQEPKDSQLDTPHTGYFMARALAALPRG